MEIDKPEILMYLAKCGTTAPDLIATIGGTGCKVPHRAQDSSRSLFAIARQHQHGPHCAEALDPARRACRSSWGQAQQTSAAHGQRPRHFRMLFRSVPADTTVRHTENRGGPQFQILVWRLGNDASQAEPGPC